MDALFELPAAAETELGLRRACQLALLRDRLEGAPEREFFPAGWLETLRLADLVRHATPFFWLNVLRCHAACDNAGAGLAVALRFLLVTGFDAFFPVAPDGFTCRLPAGDDPVIVLPRLGVRLAASGGPARLRRVSRSVLQVEDGDGQATTIPLDDVPAAARLAWQAVGGDDSARLLLSSHPALFPGSCAADMPTEPPDPAGHAAMIASALRLIQEVDPRRGKQIATAVAWYAPLISPGPEVHRSRTAPQLGGVIFLSTSRDRRLLAEAIVHEHYHGVLHTRMELEKLLIGGDEARFYSPWRDDPRPLAGLLHALYVFSGVAEFLLRAEASPSLAEERGALRGRRRLVVERLRLGHAQAPVEHFTPAGRRLLDGLKEVIDRHEAELELPRDRLPDPLVAHLDKWCAANPHLAALVRRPVRSGA